MFIQFFATTKLSQNIQKVKFYYLCLSKTNENLGYIIAEASINKTYMFLYLYIIKSFFFLILLIIKVILLYFLLFEANHNQFIALISNLDIILNKQVL